MSNPANCSESFVYTCECGDEFENVELLSTHLLEKHNAVLLLDDEKKTELQVQIPLNEDINRDVILESIENVESTVTIEEQNEEPDESNGDQHNIQTNNLSPSTEHALHEYFCKNLQMDRNEKIRICETCRKMFLNKQSFISHCLNAHTTSRHGNIYRGTWRKGRPYTCEKCGETFLSRPNFLRHQAARHSEIQPFRCPVCLRSFTTKHDLKTHFRLHTEGQIKVQHEFKSSQKADADDVCVTCNFCSKEFKNKQKLVIHMRVHSTERPYQCPLCPKAFRKSVYLKVHNRIHTGEKPFPCPMCPKRFRSSVNLANHKRIHTGERPYLCESCPKAFKSKLALSRHIRVHTGEKPFTCGFCLKAFSQSNTRKLHIRTVHMKLPWPYKKKPKNAALDEYKFETDL